MKKSSSIIIWFTLLLGVGFSKSIRIKNLTDKDFTNVSIMKQNFGDIPSGETSEYKDVKTILSYAAMKLTIDVTYVTGQTLNIGPNSFTYNIVILDLEKGWVKIDVKKE